MSDLFNDAVPAIFFNPQISEKVDNMTRLSGKLAFVVAAGGLSLAALSPTPVEAGAIHWSQGLAAAPGDRTLCAFDVFAARRILELQ